MARVISNESKTNSNGGNSFVEEVLKDLEGIFHSVKLVVRLTFENILVKRDELEDGCNLKRLADCVNYIKTHNLTSEESILNASQLYDIGADESTLLLIAFMEDSLT